MNDLRLFRLFQPTRYDIHLVLEREKRQFSGTVTIEGTTTADATAIPLHAHKLHIIHATIDDQLAEYSHGDHDALRLTVPTLAPGKHTVRIEFAGEITDPMHGLYPCYFTLDDHKEELLVTQFESHHARDVFPCVDEPEAKATFDLTLTTEQHVTTVSNTPIKQQIEADGHLTTTFETTPIMSTYLLAWVVGKLEYQEKFTHDGIAVRAYATPANKAKLGYALDEAVRYLEFFNDYFDVPYPLAKCDFLAIPDFSAGAMENWGCITFRETTLLVDEHSSTHTKQYVTLVIAHEIAHQWFGDLVTMQWWNDIWLNESFANLMQYIAPAELHPDWDILTQRFKDETMRAFDRDSLRSVQKIQQDIHDPSEIEALFDPAIVYAKGGSLLAMLHDYIGAEAFRDGLRIYLKQHQYRNTTAHDLWRALGEASGRDVAAFMEPWITQSGLPVVTVGVSQNTVNLHQRRFFKSPLAARNHDQSRWPLPLLANDQLGSDLLTEASASFPAGVSAKPLLINQGRSGYYLSLYDTDHTRQLSEEVARGTLATIDRLGLLTDYLHLAKAGLQTHLSALMLLETYRNEHEESVWSAISAHIHALKVLADNDEVELADLRRFVHRLAEAQFKRLGWQAAAGEPYQDTLLRTTIIGHMAYAEDDAVIAKLRQLFDAATSPTNIDADIRATTLATAVAFGGKPAFEKALAWHNETPSAEQRSQIVAGLCATRDPALVQQALGLLTADAVRLQDLFYWVIFMSRNRYSREAVWQWTQDNWQWITDHFGNGLHYTSFPKYLAGAFSHQAELASYKLFFEPLMNIPALTRIIAQGIEDIEARVLWRERDAAAVADYLHQ